MACQSDNLTKAVISSRSSAFFPTFSFLLLLLLFSLRLTPPASAQRGEDFVRLLTPVRDRPQIELDTQVLFYPSGTVRHEDTRWRQYKHKTSFQVPLAGSRNHLWSTGFFFHQLNLSTEATLPRTPETPLPDRLSDLEFNLSYRRLFQNGHYLGLTGKLGSASDQPFHSRHEIDLNLLALWQIPSEQNRNWLLFLSYASRRPALNLDHIPLPGIAHFWRIDNGDWFMLGIPASAMQSEIIPTIRLNLFYLPVRNLNASITWEPSEKVRLYTRLNWESDRFWRTAREDSDQSLNFDHKKISIGCRWSVREKLSLEAETGMVFGRSVYEAEKYSRRSDNRLDIAAGWFAGMRVDWRF